MELTEARCLDSVFHGAYMGTYLLGAIERPSRHTMRICASSSTSQEQVFADSTKTDAAKPFSGSLTKCVQSLPAELFNLILRLTLYPTANLQTAANALMSDVRDHIPVNHKWSPPAVLQIDTTSREAGAKVYYFQQVFHFDYTSRSFESSLARCLRWLRTLKVHHLYHVRQIRLQDPFDMGEFRLIDCSEAWQALRLGAPKTHVRGILSIHPQLNYLVRDRCNEWRRIFRRVRAVPDFPPVFWHDCYLQPKCTMHNTNGLVFFTEIYYSIGKWEQLRSAWMPVASSSRQMIIDVLMNELEKLKKERRARVFWGEVPTFGGIPSNMR